MAVLCINRFNQSTIIEYATLSLVTHPLTLDFINIYSICVVMPAPRIHLTRRSPGLGNYIIEMSIILISHSSSGASINHVWLSALGKCHFSKTPSCCQHLRGSKWGLDVYRGWDTDDICTHIYLSQLSRPSELRGEMGGQLGNIVLRPDRRRLSTLTTLNSNCQQACHITTTHFPRPVNIA